MIEKRNPHGESVRKFFNPINIILHLFRHRDLIWQLTWRDVTGRYKGSIVGLGWSFFHPLVMLCVYTFVFSVIFRARWGIEADESKAAFALTLFMGLITFGIFSELVNAAPSLILDHANYVKKVVFPLEILPVVKVLSALINALFSLSVLVVGMLVVYHFIPWTFILFPIIWLPMIIFSLGCGYFLASLGVFLRDIGAAIGILTTMLLFLTPIFYPLRAVPEKYRMFSRINILAEFVEESRKVVLWGLLPDWLPFFICTMVSILVFVAGFLWFMKTKKAFADVV